MDNRNVKITEISRLSTNSYVRKLKEDDLETIYQLSIGNRIFYEHHPPFVTRESILEDMNALPPGKGYEDKLYIGFFSENKLLAVMDLIQGFPRENVAFIGLFMMDRQYQGKGIGSQIIQECIQCLRESGFRTVQLGVDKGNPQSFAFWKKNGFHVIEESSYIRMELDL